jgi:cysteine synthase
MSVLTKDPETGAGAEGTTVAAALRVAVRGGYEGPVVAVLADSWDRYLCRPWLRPS